MSNPQLKIKVLPRFPSSVTVTSPLTLSQIGGNYSFGLDATALEATLDARYSVNGNAITVNFGNRITLLTNNTSPSHGNFVMSVEDGGNPYLDIGYNVLAQNWTLINPNDLGLFFGQEADYDDGSGHHKMEQYWQLQVMSGQVPVGGQATARRAIMVQWDKVTTLPTAMFLSSGVTNGFQWGINDGTGSATVEQVVGKLKAQLTGTVFNIYNQPGGGTLAFSVNSTATSGTGVLIAANDAGGGVNIEVISSGTNENLLIDAKGSGIIQIGGNSTGPISLVQSVSAFAALLSKHATAGVGYSTGAGGAVTQLTSRATGVTLNKVSGAITLFAAAPAVGTWVSCTVTNSAVAATDTVIVSVKSGTNTYIAHVTSVAAGSFQLSFTSIVGTASDSPVINFNVIKGVIS